jgi:predicted dehydrogenase
MKDESVKFTTGAPCTSKTGSWTRTSAGLAAQQRCAGAGALGDLGAHIIDLARMLVGEVASITGLTNTFIKQRPVLAGTTGGLGAAAGQEMGEVTVDDAALFLARFANGAVGSFEATRFAKGRANYNSFEINGSKGSIVFDLQRMNELNVFFDDDPPEVRGFRNVLVTEGAHKYIGAWWPAGILSAGKYLHPRCARFTEWNCQRHHPGTNFC